MCRHICGLGELLVKPSVTHVSYLDEKRLGCMDGCLVLYDDFAFSQFPIFSSQSSLLSSFENNMYNNFHNKVSGTNDSILSD